MKKILFLFLILSICSTANADLFTSGKTKEGARPSQFRGRTMASVVVSGSASDLNALTVSGNKTFYATDVLLYVNNAATNVGLLQLEDATTSGGAVVLPVVIEAATASGDVVTEVSKSFLEPVSFSTGIYLNHVSGNLSASGVILGYEE